ncbi:MAG: hypothetical protein R6X13_07100 [bacterium]
MQRIGCALFAIACVSGAIWAEQGSSNLIVDMHPFNYSDGSGSDEAASFQRRQGGFDGQPHFTFDVTGGVSAYYIFLFPDRSDTKDRLRKYVKSNEGLSKLTGSACPAYWSHDDPRPNIREGLWGRIHLEPGKTIIEDLPPGGYYILPAVEFNSSCYTPGHWYPAFYDENVTINGADLTPVLWCGHYVQLSEGDTAWVEVSPQPFNIYWSSAYTIDRFVKAAILGVSYSDLAQ